MIPKYVLFHGLTRIIQKREYYFKCTKPNLKCLHHEYHLPTLNTSFFYKRGSGGCVRDLICQEDNAFQMGFLISYCLTTLKGRTNLGEAAANAQELNRVQHSQKTQE